MPNRSTRLTSGEMGLIGQLFGSATVYVEGAVASGLGFTVSDDIPFTFSGGSDSVVAVDEYDLKRYINEELEKFSAGLNDILDESSVPKTTYTKADIFTLINSRLNQASGDSLGISRIVFACNVTYQIMAAYITSGAAPTTFSRHEMLTLIYGERFKLVNQFDQSSSVDANRGLGFWVEDIAAQQYQQAAMAALIASQTVPPTFWYSLYGDLSSNTLSEQTFAVAYDDAMNVFVVGSVTISSIERVLLAKFSRTGLLQWHKQFTLNSISGTFILTSLRKPTITTDHQGNIYTVTTVQHASPSTYGFITTKYNNDGVVVWSQFTKSGSTASSNQLRGCSVAYDRSGNVYAYGYGLISGSSTTGIKHLVVVKYNTSGVLQWQKTIAMGTTNVDMRGAITVDGSGNVYIANTKLTPAEDTLLLKLDSAGAIVWQKSIGGTVDKGSGVVADSNNNIYVAGLRSPNGTGGNALYLIKYNSAGTLQWQRQLGQVTATGTPQQYETVGLCTIDTDIADNIYMCGSYAYKEEDPQNAGTYITTHEDILVAKYNSSGTIQWQRLFGSTNANTEINTGGANQPGNRNIDVAANTFCFAGYTGAPSNIFVAQFPNDGSEVGSLGPDFYYNTATLPEAALTGLVDTGDVVTTANGNLVNADVQMSDAAPAQAYRTVVFGP